MSIGLDWTEEWLSQQNDSIKSWALSKIPRNRLEVVLFLTLIHHSVCRFIWQQQVPSYQSCIQLAFNQVFLESLKIHILVSGDAFLGWLTLLTLRFQHQHHHWSKRETRTIRYFLTKANFIKLNRGKVGASDKTLTNIYQWQSFRIWSNLYSWLLFSLVRLPRHYC